MKQNNCLNKQSLTTRRLSAQDSFLWRVNQTSAINSSIAVKVEGRVTTVASLSWDRTGVKDQSYLTSEDQG